MILEDANISLKMECALRDLGFVEFDWRVVAHAGLYFVRAVGFYYTAGQKDDLLGFQIEKSEDWDYDKTGLCLGKPIAQSARQAIELALNLS
jgi:hypothetical protein